MLINVPSFALYEYDSLSNDDIRLPRYSRNSKLPPIPRYYRNFVPITVPRFYRGVPVVPIETKFHYTVQLASRSQPVRDQFHYTTQLATSSRAGRKLDSVMEFGRELVCDLLASKIA